MNKANSSEYYFS